MEAVVLVVFVLFVFAWKSARPRVKGGIGERKVAWTLSGLDENEYVVLNDLLLKSKTGSAQIDHLVVSRQGIFVIETKFYDGWIFGHENAEYWTQNMYGKKTRFLNPIRQNQTHVRALKNLLSDIDGIPFIPIVVFAGRGVLKGVNTESPVIYSRQLRDTIMENRNTTSVLSPDQVKSIGERLKQANVPDRSERKTHIHRARNASAIRSQRERSGLCPRCGGQLVARSGRHGRFMGCTNYPKCRYTRNA